MKLFTIKRILIFSFVSILLLISENVHGEYDNQDQNVLTTTSQDKSYQLDERFQRPSKLPAVKLKYYFYPKDEVPPYIADGFPTVYESSEDVIHGYFAIVKEAANMSGYFAGCGTIAWGKIPFPYAYRLFTEETKKELSLQTFEESFKGTGATNLLHLIPAYEPPNTPEDVDYYFVETEVLKGYPYDKNKPTRTPNYFEYYYGIITTKYDKKEGWQIDTINYLPEIYLCHPHHGWGYKYKSFIDITYNYWYKMNLKITEEKIENNVITIYANNNKNQYKFIFVRLTNGDDVLLHEYIKKDNKWEETTILKPDVASRYKFSILSFKDK